MKWFHIFNILVKLIYRCPSPRSSHEERPYGRAMGLDICMRVVLCTTLPPTTYDGHMDHIMHALRVVNNDKFSHEHG
jgi:hypothetical protein